MNYAGFTADTFGNHNFDEGIAHLQDQIDLADFRYVSANLDNVEDNLTGVSPFIIKKVGGVKVAIIGVTNPEAPTLVAPGALGSIVITDPAPAAMAARAQAEALGAKVFIAIGHLGIEGTDAGGNPTGPLTEFANTVQGFDLILAVLEHSVSSAPNAFGGFLQISGFRFTYNSDLPAGSRVVSVSLADGTPILRDATTYTTATNDFTNAGGDGHVELADGQGTTRNLMAKDLVDYITAQGTISPTTDGRIDDIFRADA